MSSNITLFISTDNKQFAFSTECITTNPLSAFIPYYIDFTIVNDVKVIKLSLLSSIIKAYILLATGTPIIPLSNGFTNHTENIHNINNISGNLEIITLNVSEDEDNNDISKFIDDDNMFKEFDEFVRSSMFDARN